MGGKNKRSAFYYDLWTMKYVKGLTWDDLSADLKQRKRLQQKRLVTHIAHAKREAQLFLEQREQARVEDKIELRRLAKAAKRATATDAATAADAKPAAAKEAREAQQTKAAKEAQHKQQQPQSQLQVQGKPARPGRRDAEPSKALDDAFLAQFLGGKAGGGQSTRGLKRARPKSGDA